MVICFCTVTGVTSIFTQGTLCEIDLDKCHPSPCSNGATCVNDANEVEGYRCECAPGFFGLRCISQECNGTGMCLNGATCVTYVSGFDSMIVTMHLSYPFCDHQLCIYCFIFAAGF